MSNLIKEEVVFLSLSDCEALDMLFEWEEDTMVRGHSDWIYGKLEEYLEEIDDIEEEDMDEDDTKYDLDEIREFLEELAPFECTCIVER